MIKKIFFLILVIFGFVGCTVSDGGRSGGVMKSVDSGREFETANFISEKKTLAYSNVLSLKIHPQNHDFLYAGTVKNDLYYSNDGAQTWTQLPTRLTNIYGIVLHPLNTDVIYVSGLYKGRGSVVKTTDKGNTWNRVYLEPKNGSNITSLAISPFDGNLVYIGTSAGTIIRTTNGGDTWENLYDADENVTDIVIDGVNAQIIYALVGTHVLLRSQDGGHSFENLNSIQRTEDIKKYDGSIYSIATSSTQAGLVVIGTNQGVYRSNDFGYSWDSVEVIASTIGIPIYAIAVNPHDANRLIYAAAMAIYINDQNNSWIITDTTSNRAVSAILYDAVDPQKIYIGLKKVK